MNQRGEKKTHTHIHPHTVDQRRGARFLISIAMGCFVLCMCMGALVHCVFGSGSGFPYVFVIGDVETFERQMEAVQREMHISTEDYIPVSPGPVVQHQGTKTVWDLMNSNPQVISEFALSLSFSVCVCVCLCLCLSLPLSSFAPMRRQIKYQDTHIHTYIRQPADPHMYTHFIDMNKHVYEGADVCR